MEAAGFHTAPLHNQVITLGEWGWILGSKRLPPDMLKTNLQELEFNKVETRWLNTDAMKLMTSFGKDVFEEGEVEVNSIHNPVLFKYYRRGAWDLY